MLFGSFHYKRLQEMLLIVFLPHVPWLKSMQERFWTVCLCVWICVYWPKVGSFGGQGQSRSYRGCGLRNGSLTRSQGEGSEVKGGGAKSENTDQAKGFVRVQSRNSKHYNLPLSFYPLPPSLDPQMGRHDAVLLQSPMFLSVSASI